MSIEILYRRQYIKVKDNLFCPIIEMGSSNCYDASSGRNGKMRRSRSWQNASWLVDGKLLVSKEDIIQSMDNDKQKMIDRNNETLKEYPDWEKYDDKLFGYFMGVSFYGKSTRTTTFSQYKSFFVNGCNEAVTVEQLLENHISINIHAYAWDSKKTLEETGKQILRVYPKSTQEFIDEVENFTTYYKGTNITFYVSIDVWGDNLERMKRKLNTKVKKEKQKIEVTEFYVLENAFGYFVKKTGRGYRYSYYLVSSTKKFMTEKEAQKYLDKTGLDFKVKKIESNCTFYK